MALKGRRRFGSLVAEKAKSPTPFLKWAGGKAQLLDQMKEWFPDNYRAYIEPFLGGGAIFFYLMPKRAVLGDLNSELINVYNVVHNDLESLTDKLDVHHPHVDNRDYYELVRSEDPKDLDEVSRAARMMFLNKTCFNGLYRVNSKGEFNVPFGRYSNPQLYDRENVIACSKALNGIQLVNSDYRETLKRARKNDFVYLDPPYHHLSNAASFTSYTSDSFLKEDQIELSHVFERLNKKGCNIMMSNSATELIEELYKDFHIETLKARRMISSRSETRGEIDEFLIMNYEV